MIGLRALDDPGHITVAFGALAAQQQVASLESAGEVGNGRFVAAMATPDIRQQSLTDVGGNQLPVLTGWLGESGL